jgi:hypothetical protein
MDLTTLAAAVVLAFGLLTADAVMNSEDVVVDVVAPPRSDKISIDEATLDQIFEGELHEVSEARSLIQPREIHASRQQGVALALAQSAHVEGVAHALQTEMGYEPDRLRLALFVQDGAVRGMVTGFSRAHGSFQHLLVPQNDESLPAFVRRAALWGSAQIAPYTTAIHLLQAHSADKDFSGTLALVAEAEDKLPPTPVSLQRSLFENIRGLVFLFQNDSKNAEPVFASAVAADRNNPVAVLNLAFDEIELNKYQAAADRMQRLIGRAAPSNSTLLGTAYMTWAAAELGLHNAPRADVLMAQAMQADPGSSTGYELWSEVKGELGDHTAEAALHHKALEETADSFDNYAEVAALYFRLSWHDDAPVMHNQFADQAPGTIE